MIAIVGAGAAGWSAAQALRDFGYEGQVRVFGAEAAGPYERPTLSKAFLTDDLDDPPALSALGSRSPDTSLELDTPVVSIDAQARTLDTADGRRLAYERLLLATGATPRRLDLPGSQLAGIHYLRDVSDARALRAELEPGRRIVLIGGGVVGLEVASSALARGCEVTVIELAAQLMGRIVPAEFADTLQALHSGRGITIRTGIRPTAFDAAGRRIGGVALSTGELLPADAVVVGIGAAPRTAVAVSAGLTVDNGVLVDERFRSSDEHIFAAGDVANVIHAAAGRRMRIEQWRPAQEQGRHAAASMVGAGEPYCDVPWMWSDQHDFHVQVSGFGFDDTEIVARGDLQAREGLAYLGIRDDRLVAVCGVCVGTGIAKAVRAAQILIQERAPVGIDTLRDPELDLRRLAMRVASGVGTE